MMKKILALLLALLTALMMFSGCSGDAETPAETKTAAEIYSAVEAAVELPEMMPLDADYIEAYYGIDIAMLSDYCFYCAVEAMDVETVIVARVADSANVETITAALENLRDMKKIELESYAPELYDIVNASSVLTKGDTVSLVISENADAINSVIDQYI